jgi:hypothetical protein
MGAQTDAIHHRKEVLIGSLLYVQKKRGVASPGRLSTPAPHNRRDGYASPGSDYN